MTRSKRETIKSWLASAYVSLLVARREVKYRTEEGLPLAGGPRVLGDLKVGLEAELAVKRRQDLALVGAVAGEEGALQECLQEELAIESTRSRVERGSLCISAWSERTIRQRFRR